MPKFANEIRFRFMTLGNLSHRDDAVSLGKPVAHDALERAWNAPVTVAERAATSAESGGCVLDDFVEDALFLTTTRRSGEAARR